VSLRSSDNRWRATIRGENGREELGEFTNKSDAIAVRKAREVEIGYHKNHGRVIGACNE
jgi:hypothetical protein